MSVPRGEGDGDARTDVPDNSNAAEAVAADVPSDPTPDSAGSGASNVSTNGDQQDTSTDATATQDVALTEGPAFGVSTNGNCPYCGSNWVRYLILAEEGNTDDSNLSPTLATLLEKGYATKVTSTPDIPEPSSFMCNSCNYGFNLDWSQTSLEKIFYYVFDPAKTSNNAAAPNDPAYWNRDSTQWNLTQQHYNQNNAANGQAHASALDAVLNRIDGASSGAGSAAPSTNSAIVTGPRAGQGTSSKFVTSFRDYSMSANFTGMHERFAAQSNDEYWEKKKIPKNRDMRLISHFMDPSQLEEGPSSQPNAKKRKVSKQDVKKFKEVKAQRKYEKKTAYLREP